MKTFDDSGFKEFIDYEVKHCCAFESSRNLKNVNPGNLIIGSVSFEEGSSFTGEQNDPKFGDKDYWPTIISDNHFS